MTFKLYILAGLLVAVSCQYNHHGASSQSSYSAQAVAPVYHHSHGSYEGGAFFHGAHPDSHPLYRFAYNVHNPHSHDVKSQEESRNGHYVKGSYSLVEPDGSRRVVHYSDNGHGFEAVVHKEGGYHSAPVYHH